MQGILSEHPAHHPDHRRNEQGVQDRHDGDHREQAPVEHVRIAEQRLEHSEQDDARCAGERPR